MLGWGGPAAAAGGATLWGLGMGANWTLGTTAMQLTATRETLGRVVAMDALLFTVAWGAGAFVAASLFEALPLPALAISLGAGATCVWALLGARRGRGS